jgi:superfamily II RNA helicase
VVEALKRRDLLPAIVFLFSRNGCDRAGAEIGGVATKLGLLTPQEKQTVKDRIQVHNHPPRPSPLYSKPLNAISVRRMVVVSSLPPSLC